MLDRFLVVPKLHSDSERDILGIASDTEGLYVLNVFG